MGGQASLLACEEHLHAVRELQRKMAELFDPRKLRVRMSDAELSKKISLAKELAASANDEPRFWRTPWRNTLFNQSCQTLEDVRAILSTIAYTVTESGGHKTELFLHMLRWPQFGIVRHALLKQLDNIEMLSGIFLHEKGGRLMGKTRSRPPPQPICPCVVRSEAWDNEYNDDGNRFVVRDHPDLQRDYKGELEAAIREIIADINLAGPQPAPERSLEEDKTAVVSLCLSSFQHIMARLHALQNLMLLDA
eukprot:gnl/TRDRNA2_/TRDRNA2_195615_c0_seq1.p1 gnl/TRDRNA2_/TRDRNA2_195615_c0~~gnl/TRDRNA2_/TRDRNA2_195615_c0_seq1.p1  ORF type:complete len:250 (-),score=34.46 gnl/TRDRNA2_/TRDRNA2_195615_c0_seq1:46-795(-)